MSLQEIDSNKIIISCLSSSSSSLIDSNKRKRDEFNSKRSKSSQTYFAQVRVFVVTLRLFERKLYAQIEKNTNVKSSITSNIVRSTQIIVNNDDFQKIIICSTTKLTKEKLFIIFNNFQISHYIRSIILNEKLFNNIWKKMIKHVNFSMTHSIVIKIDKKHRDFEYFYVIT